MRTVMLFARLTYLSLNHSPACFEDMPYMFLFGLSLARKDQIVPQDLAGGPQVAFQDNQQRSFSQWASGIGGEEKILCTVNTAQAAMALVAAGVGVCVFGEDCVQDFSGVCFRPMKNWHQALYLCILYDKWLEPPVWAFVEKLIKILRSLYQTEKL